MRSGMALGAAASLLPLAAPQAASAANKVLSADWEKVRQACCGSGEEEKRGAAKQ